MLDLLSGIIDVALVDDAWPRPQLLHQSLGGLGLAHLLYIVENGGCLHEVLAFKHFVNIFAVPMLFFDFYLVAARLILVVSILSHFTNIRIHMLFICLRTLL